MGTDIHAIAEVKKERWVGNYSETPQGLPWVIGEGGSRWVEIDEEIFPSGYYDPTSSYAPFKQEFTSKPLDNRNYTLFALLADVRNGRGFAGVRTGDRITPLSDPRGVPTDASYGWLATVDSWGPDLHSHTWFTLAELLEANPLYDQRLVRTGVIPGAMYEKLRAEGGKPEEWSGSISGPKIITVTPEEYDAGVRADEWTQEEVENMREQWRAGRLSQTLTIGQIDERLNDYLSDGRTYVQWVWEDSLRESTQPLHQMIAALKRYADDLRPVHVWKPEENDAEDMDKPGYYGNGGIPYEDIRVCIAFDN